MKADGYECIWKGQCEEECPENCQDFTPADDALDDEEYYIGVLKENADEYQKVIKQFSCGRAWGGCLGTEI